MKSEFCTQQSTLQFHIAENLGREEGREGERGKGGEGGEVEGGGRKGREEGEEGGKRGGREKGDHKLLQMHTHEPPLRLSYETSSVSTLARPTLSPLFLFPLFLLSSPSFPPFFALPHLSFPPLPSSATTLPVP